MLDGGATMRLVVRLFVSLAMLPRLAVAQAKVASCMSDGGNEGGAVYQVVEIDSAGFRGRWEDGGIGIAFVQRGNLHTLERLRGFYCARRLR